MMLFVGGVIWGALSKWLMPGGAGWAQELAATVKDVRAVRFVLVNQTGQELGALCPLSGGGGLQLRDSAGNIRLFMLVSNNDPVIWFRDEAANVRAEVGMSARAESFVLVDETGRRRAELGMDDDQPVLRLLDEAKVVRASLNLLDDWPKLVITDPSGRIRTNIGYSVFPSVGLFDEDGNIGATLSMPDGRPTLGLFDEGKARGVFGLDASGSPSLSLLNAEGHLRAALGSTTTENTETGAVTTFPISTITLFGDNGRVQWQAP